MVKNIDLEGICHFEVKQEKGLQFEQGKKVCKITAVRSASLFLFASIAVKR